ncbi:hypothetical protein RvY_07772 [Ramazzottius varieornatus]|uniref:Uncharacterized protein n=1 Tax=Ramazzottius varieornatus TaxID=947166 RepID=A0A1D1V3F9_RAMVA|nr:hypothetical protein RvY_07772 [Ramazzottius varieornatus]
MDRDVFAVQGLAKTGHGSGGQLPNGQAATTLVYDKAELSAVMSVKHRILVKYLANFYVALCDLTFGSCGSFNRSHAGWRGVGFCPNKKQRGRKLAQN